jgi:N-acetylglutamate synthase
MPVVLDQAWVGRRIVVRRAVPGGLGDVIGELLGLTPDYAVLSTRNGEVQIERAQITAARLVEASTAAILALETIAARGWAPAESEIAHGWLLRADHGFSTRANSALALRAPVPDLATALAAVSAWYAARGLPTQLAVPLPPRQALDSALAKRGWAAAFDTAMLVTSTGQLASQVGPAASVQLTERPDERWLDAYQHRSGPAKEVVLGLLTRHDRVRFAEIELDGRLVAIARGTVNDSWLGVSAVAVDGEYRRRGLARALMVALAAWGAALGATQTYLQVEQTNTAALELYRGSGFWTHHTYRYRAAPTMGA